MPWNDAIEREYDDLMAGDIGDAFGYTGLSKSIFISLVKWYLEQVETGSGRSLNLSPGNETYLTGIEKVLLHCMRVACCLYTERNGVWPWSLQDKSIAELEPLLHYDYQGLAPYTLPSGETVYTFRKVWDVRPMDRMSIAVLAYMLMVIFGDPPTSEREFVLNYIQTMRDNGWHHMSGSYDIYVDEGCTPHSPSGIGTYDYEDIAEIKQGGCHTTSNFIVASLRPFNIPAHVGYGRGEDLHRNGHCFVHYASLDWWFAHGDDVYNAVLRNIPPEFAMRTDWWINTYHRGTTDYVYHRAKRYDDYMYWCLLIARSSTFNYDVYDLYFAGELRSRLENLHTELSSMDGAPGTVPPIYNDATVDAMMDWVEAKLGPGGG